MAALVLYGSSVADGTLTTACDMSSATGGTETSKQTTMTGSNLNGEVWSKGNASLADVAAIPATPTGNGWVYATGAGSFALGNWSASAKLQWARTTNSPTWTMRFFRHSAGVYTSIGTITITNTSGGITTYSFPATSMSAITFGASDLLYVDLWVTSTSTLSGINAIVYESTSAVAGVASDMQVTTPSFGGVTATKDVVTRLRLAKLKDIVTRLSLVSAKQLSDTASRLRLAKLKDIAARLRLASALQLKDTAARLSLARLKDNATRLRFVSALLRKDTATRLALARLLNVSLRLRLARLVDVAARVRFMSARQLKDSATRLLVARLKDASLRLRLARAKENATRLRLASASQLRDLFLRLRLVSALQLKDGVTRVRIRSAAQLRDLPTRLSLSTFPDVLARLRMALGNDIVGRLLLNRTTLLDTVARLWVATLHDSSLRFSPASLGDSSVRLLLAFVPIRLFSATRLLLTKFVDTAGRVRLSLLQQVGGRLRLASASVRNDEALRLRLASAAILRNSPLRVLLAFFRDAPARLRLARLRESITRLRLASALLQPAIFTRLVVARLRESSTRVRLARLVENVTRFSLQQAITRNVFLRLRLAVLRESASRLKLATLRETGTRFRQQSASQVFGSVTRVRLASLREYTTRLLLGRLIHLASRLSLARVRDLGMRFPLFIQRTWYSATRLCVQSASQVRDLPPRLRLAALRESQTRFRQQSAPRVRDLALRLAVRVQQVRDVGTRALFARLTNSMTRLRLAHQGDVPLRLYFSSPKQFKDTSGRLSLAHLLDMVGRLRLAHSLEQRMRLRIARLRDVAGRLLLGRFFDLHTRLGLAHVYDLACHLRFVSVLRQPSLPTRYVLAVVREVRGRLYLARMGGIGARLLTNSAVQLRNIPVRVRLARLVGWTARIRLASFQDAPGRYRIVGFFSKAAPGRIALAAFRDLPIRLRLASAAHLRDLAVRLWLARRADSPSRTLLARVWGIRVWMLFSVSQTTDTRVRLLFAHTPTATLQLQEVSSASLFAAHSEVDMSAPNTTVQSTILVTDQNNLPVATASSITLLITFPDQSTANLTLLGGGITNLNNGNYQAKYTTKGSGPLRELWTVIAGDGITMGTFQFETVTGY